MAVPYNFSPDLKQPLLLDGNPGALGQTPVSQGPDDPPYWGSSQVGTPNYVGDNPPTPEELSGNTVYLWWQTTAGSAEDLTLWIEDGT